MRTCPSPSHQPLRWLHSLDQAAWMVVVPFVKHHVLASQARASRRWQAGRLGSATHIVFEVSHSVTGGRAAVWSALASSRSSLVIDSLLCLNPRSSGVRWFCAWQSLSYVPTALCWRLCFQLMAGQREGDRMHGKMSQARHENAALPSITHWLELSTFTENMVSLIPRRKRRWGSEHCLSRGHIKDEMKQ